MTTYILPTRSQQLHDLDDPTASVCIVVTYQLAYGPGEVELCQECVDHCDHDAGDIGSVNFGGHDGVCEGAHHGEVRQ